MNVNLIIIHINKENHPKKNHNIKIKFFMNMHAYGNMRMTKTHKNRKNQSVEGSTWEAEVDILS